MQDIENPVIKHDIEEPVVWGRCSDCGEIICMGDDYYTNGEEKLCLECMDKYVMKTAQTRGPI